MNDSDNTKGCLVRSSINVDEYLSVEHIVREGETIGSSAYSRRPGGKGANAAVGLAKAGVRVSFVGLIGHDAMWLKETIEGYGVNVDQLKSISELPTGRAIIQVSKTGENSIVLVHGANHAPAKLWPPLKIDSSIYSHLLLQNEIPLSETCAALKEAKNGGVCTIFNPSPLPTPSEIQNKIPWKEVDWLIVNQEEARALTNASGPDHRVDVDIKIESGQAGDLQDTLISLIRSSFSDIGVVMTLGANGCQVGFRAKSSEQSWTLFSSSASKGKRPVIDTTGAGDCFTAYLIAQLISMESEKTLSLDDVKRAISLAGKAARICVEKEGTIDSYPSLKEVLS
ncbi:Ribokinase-like protein [Melampsora americana]|nr:Ribokinase-like protein [Melampsora americana]